MTSLHSLTFSVTVPFYLQVPLSYSPVSKLLSYIYIYIFIYIHFLVRQIKNSKYYLVISTYNKVTYEKPRTYTGAPMLPRTQEVIPSAS